MLILPFNNNSGQPLVITSGNYTIPAGKYAFLSAHCTNGETLIIDGTQAQIGGSTVIHRTVSTVGDGLGTVDVYTIPNDGVSYFEGTATSNHTLGFAGAGGIVISSGADGTQVNMPVKVGPGQDIQAATPANGAANGASCAVSGYEKKDGVDTTQTYWLSEGTALTGTATKTITLYDIT